MISSVIPWPTSVTTSEQLGLAGTQRNQVIAAALERHRNDLSMTETIDGCQQVARIAVTPDVCEEHILGPQAVQGCDSVEGGVQEPTTPC